MTWTLWICAAISYNGCGVLENFHFEDQNTCFQALVNMQTDADKKSKAAPVSFIATCKPEKQS